MKTFLHWTILIPLSELTPSQGVHLSVNLQLCQWTMCICSYTNHTGLVTKSFEIKECNLANFLLLPKLF